MGDLVRARPRGQDAAALSARYLEPAQVADKYLLTFRSPATRAAYRRDLVAVDLSHRQVAAPAFLQWCELVDIDPWTLDRFAFTLWLRSLDETRLSAASVLRRVSAVRGFYEYAVVIENLMPASPIPKDNKHLHLAPRPAESSTRGLSRPEAEALMRAARARGPRETAIVAALYHQLLRATELCDLDVGDLGRNAEHRTLTIDGKGDKRREVVLAPPAARAIDAWLTWRTEQGMLDLALALPTERPAQSPLFVDGRGHRLNRYHVRDLVARLARDATIADPGTVTPHVWRHTGITHLLDDGVPLRDVQVYAGHARSTTTEGYDRRRGQLNDRSPAYRLAGLDSGP